MKKKDIFIKKEQLQSVTINEAKRYITPIDDYFLQEDLSNYNKAINIFKALSIVTWIFIPINVIIILYIGNQRFEGAISGGQFIVNPELYLLALPEIFFQFLLIIISIVNYVELFKVNKNITQNFQEKNFVLIKRLVILSITSGFIFFLSFNILFLGAPKYTIIESIIYNLTFLIMYVILNIIIIIPTLNSEIESINPLYKKSKYQKIINNVLTFVIGSIFVFYGLYKIVWALFPSFVHSIGDSGASISLIFIIPLGFSLLPLYSMKEKLVKGYLISKFYIDFANDKEYEESLNLWKPDKSDEPKWKTAESANANKRHK